MSVISYENAIEPSANWALRRLTSDVGREPKESSPPCSLPAPSLLTPCTFPSPAHAFAHSFRLSTGPRLPRTTSDCQRLCSCRAHQVPRRVIPLRERTVRHSSLFIPHRIRPFPHPTRPHLRPFPSPPGSAPPRSLRCRARSASASRSAAARSASAPRSHLPSPSPPLARIAAPLAASGLRY